MNWTLTRKVSAVAVFYLVLVVGLVIAMLWSTLKTQDILTYVSRDLVKEVHLAGDYNTLLQRVMTEAISYAFTREEAEYAEAAEAMESLDAIVESLNTTHHLLDAELAAQTNPDTTQPAEWARLVDTARHIVADLATLDTDDDPQEAAIEIGEAAEELEAQREVLSDEFDAYVTRIRMLSDQQRAQLHFITNVSVGGSVVGILLLTIAGLWLMEWRIVRPVRRLAQAARCVSDGDLHQSVPVMSQDEMGTLQQAFNTMVTQLRHQTQALEAQYARAAAALKDAEAARDESEAARQEVAEQLATIQQQQEMIRALSVPILPLSATTLVMPLIGTIDTQRAQQIMETLLEGVAQHRASTVILDITGVQVIDTQVANALMRTAQAVKLLGAQIILTGIRPQIAQTLVHLGVDLRDIVTCSTLQEGIAVALGTIPEFVNSYASNGHARATGRQ